MAERGDLEEFWRQMDEIQAHLDCLLRARRVLSEANAEAMAIAEETAAQLRMKREEFRKHEWLKTDGPSPEPPSDGRGAANPPSPS